MVFPFLLLIMEVLYLDWLDRRGEDESAPGKEKR